MQGSLPVDTGAVQIQTLLLQQKSHNRIVLFQQRPHQPGDIVPILAVDVIPPPPLCKSQAKG